jgi:Ca2+-binding RTX toxin-like protein
MLSESNLQRVVALALVAPVIAFMPTPTSAADTTATCHGLPATIEAAEGDVTGTDGDDVIVVTGKVRRVDAKGGNDLICLVDTSKLEGFHIYIYIDPGAGDDIVDASAAGARTSAGLGPGEDSFIGGARADSVFVGDRLSLGEVPAGPAGPFHVTTGAGNDYLAAMPAAIVDAHLGRGNDHVIFPQNFPLSAGSEIDFGAGEDSILFEDDHDTSRADHALLVDLNAETASWHGVKSIVRDAEDIGGYARRVRLVGNREDNILMGHGCDVLLKGGAGDDHMYLSSAREDATPYLDQCSPPPRMRAKGNAGDDYFQGGWRHDVFIGGSGFDSAFGGPGGHDRCDTEKSWGKGCRG